jgi:CRP-like cAMP-binding protein
VEQALRDVSITHTPPHVLSFNGTDEALEYAEDALLAALEAPPVHAHVAVELAETDLCQDIEPEHADLLAEVMHPVHVPKGQRLFAAGEHGECLYVVLQGEVEIRLPTSNVDYKRLGVYGPCTFFGELAFFDPGPRTADAIAVADTHLLRFDHDALERLLNEGNHEAAIALLSALGKAEVQHLRWSITELSRVLQW